MGEMAKINIHPDLITATIDKDLLLKPSIDVVVDYFNRMLNIIELNYITRPDVYVLPKGNVIMTKSNQTTHSLTMCYFYGYILENDIVTPNTVERQHITLNDLKERYSELDETDQFTITLSTGYRNEQ